MSDFNNRAPELRRKATLQAAVDADPADESIRIQLERLNTRLEGYEASIAGNAATARTLLAQLPAAEKDRYFAHYEVVLTDKANEAPDAFGALIGQRQAALSSAGFLEKGRASERESVVENHKRNLPDAERSIAEFERRAKMYQDQLDKLSREPSVRVTQTKYTQP